MCFCVSVCKCVNCICALTPFFLPCKAVQDQLGIPGRRGSADTARETTHLAYRRRNPLTVSFILIIVGMVVCV